MPLEDGVTQTGPGLRRRASSTSFLHSPVPAGLPGQGKATGAGGNERAGATGRRWLRAPRSSLPFFQAVPLSAERSRHRCCPHAHRAKPVTTSVRPQLDVSLDSVTNLVFTGW